MKAEKEEREKHMIYVMSDIHGEYDKFKEVLKQINLQKEDLLYVLGDVVDRGPHPMEILLKMMAPRLGAVARRIALRLPPVTSFMVSSIRFCSSRIFWAHSTTYRPTAVGYRRRLYRRNKAKPKVRSHSARNLLSAEGETWSACAAWLRLP